MFLFFPDYTKSVLLGPHWQWSVTDILVYITGDILPFQVSLPGNPNEYHMAIIPHVYQHIQSHAQLFGTVQHSVESFCSVISFTIYHNIINHCFVPFSFSYRSLSCQRITLHKNLFLSFILNSVSTIILFTAVANNEDLVHQNPVSVLLNHMVVFVYTL